MLHSRVSMFKQLTMLYRVFVWLLLGAACGVAGPVSPAPVTIGTDVFLTPDTRTIERLVPRGATLASLLAAHELDGAVVIELVEAVRSVFNPRHLRVSYPYRLIFADNDTLRRFEYHIDEDQFLRVTNHGGVNPRFDAELILYVKERAEIAMRGEINREHSSLVSAINGGGEEVMLAIAMAEIFAGAIDFNNDLRRGDRFHVLFEKYFREDQFSGYGDVMAAEFVNGGRLLQAFRFHVPGDPEAQYFDADGRSMKRLFLRSPFRFEPRITSRFSYRRLHPVRGGHRPHLGIDYGAPIGTPVIAVANGTVVSAGRSGGSGNMVRLRHTNGYETYYLHLSSFANGIRRGARVTQGQLIGRVGRTGLATGPHLDFRMRKNGTFVNPLLEHRNLPPGDPVPVADLAAFGEVRDLARSRLLSPLSLPGTAATVLAQ